MQAGIQISSFAPLMKDAQGLERVLSALNGFECRNVQLQWIDKSVQADVVSALMTRHGMRSLGVQDRNHDVFADPEYYISLNRACGSEDICVSGIPDGVSFDAYAENFASLKARCEKEGIKLSYHPTRTDFDDNCAKCRQLLDAFRDVKLCADICQLNDNHVDPIAFLNSYAGRIHIVHFKDRGVDGSLCIVGEGKTDFEPVARVCRDIGAGYILAEQESWKGDAILSLKQGYEYIMDLLDRLGA